MPVEFTPSADKHGIPREDALYAILHRGREASMPGRDGHGDWTLYIGHPHGQTERYLEVGAQKVFSRTLIVFHCCELTDKFRHLLFEGGS